MSRRAKGIAFACLLIGAAGAFAFCGVGCKAFEGPIFTPDPCPVACGGGMCCEVDERCLANGKCSAPVNPFESIGVHRITDAGAD